MRKFAVTADTAIAPAARPDTVRVDPDAPTIRPENARAESAADVAMIVSGLPADVEPPTTDASRVEKTRIGPGPMRPPAPARAPTPPPPTTPTPKPADKTPAAKAEPAPAPTPTPVPVAATPSSAAKAAATLGGPKRTLPLDKPLTKPAPATAPTPTPAKPTPATAPTPTPAPAKPTAPAKATPTPAKPTPATAPTPTPAKPTPAVSVAPVDKPADKPAAAAPKPATDKPSDKIPPRATPSTEMAVIEPRPSTPSAEMSVIELGPPGAPVPAVDKPPSQPPPDVDQIDPLRSEDTGITTQVVPPPIRNGGEPPPVLGRAPTGEIDDLPGEPTRVTPMDIPGEPTAVTPLVLAPDADASAPKRPTPTPDAARPTPLPPGARRLGRFVAEGPIGNGASGPVFKSKDEKRDGRDVHIETLSAELDLVGTASTIASMAKLEHANLVRVYELVVHAGKPYLVREPLEGRALDAHVKKRGELPWLEAVGLVDAVCAAVIHLHDRSLVHRAVRPACIMVHDKVIKLGGAGIAPGFLDRAFTAPEILAKGGVVDTRADIYGVGAVLFYCLTGKSPGEPGNLGKAPTKLVSLVNAMIAKSPVDRPASLGGIRSSFKELLEV